MTSKKAQRVDEQFQAFSRLCDELSDDVQYENFEDTPDDPPDIYVPSHHLGIEFTEVMTSNYRIAKTKDSITAKAAEIFQEQQPDTNILVDLLWQPCAHPNSKNGKEIAQRIVELVQENLPNLASGVMRIEDEILREHALNDLLEAIEVRKSNDRISYWMSPDAGWVGVGIAQFESKIRRKEKQIPEWTTERNIKTRWLVLVAHGDYIPSLTTMLPQDENSTIPSDFDRVYFMEMKLGKLTLLSPPNQQQI